MTVLITGATGFLGRRIIRALLQRDEECRCLIHTPGNETVLDEDIDVHYGSVEDPYALAAAFYDVDTVIHLVSVIRENGNATFHKINVQGVKNVLAAATKHGVKRFIHVSAIGAEGNPNLPYLYSKWLGEQAVIESGIPYTILRPSLIFGDGGELIDTLASLVRVFPLVPILGRGDSQFRPISVDDVARCVTSVINSDEFINTITDVTGPDVFSYNQIIDSIILAMGISRLKLPMPIALSKLLVKLLEILLPHPPITMDQLNMLLTSRVSPVDTFEATFGFKPLHMKQHIGFAAKVGFLHGLKRMIGFLPSYPNGK